MQIDVGYYWTQTLTYKDSDGNAIDLTGSTIKMTIRQEKDGADVLVLNHVVNDNTTGIYIPTPTSGQFQLIILAADTVTTFLSQYMFYEISITNPSGQETLFMWGRLQYVEGFE